MCEEMGRERREGKRGEGETAAICDMINKYLDKKKRRGECEVTEKAANQEGTGVCWCMARKIILFTAFLSCLSVSLLGKDNG